MKRLLVFLLVLLLPAVLIAQVPEWRPELVLKVAYGSGSDEFGFEGITEREDTSPVNAFYIDAGFIYINDLFQGNIKTYDLSGKYLRTISTKWTLSGREMPPGNVTGMLVHNGMLYLQCHYGGIPPADQSAIYVLSYDLKTGEFVERYNIYNPLLSRSNMEDAFTYHATDLRVGPDGGIWIYDRINDRSYPLIRNGKAVNKTGHTQGIEGEKLGTRRILIDKMEGRRKLISGENAFIRDLGFIDSSRNIINSKISSKNGEYFVKHDLLGSKYTITTWDGRDIGRVTWQHKESWPEYTCHTPFQFDAEGRLYRVFAGKDGIYLYRWSR